MLTLPSRVLTVCGTGLYIQRGQEIVLLDLESGEELENWRLPGATWQVADRRLIRLKRLGVQALIPVADHSVLILENQRLYRLNLASGELEAEFREFQGTRPLFLCRAEGGELYFGEYFSNPGREPVRIFSSQDQGLTFQEIFRFPAGQIRHVHGVFADRFSGDLWVTTGDRDAESGIWRTSDRFQTLEPVLKGDQGYRAVQLLFLRDSIYFGSDTPHQQNYICRLERKTGLVEKLQDVQGSVFYGCQVGEALFFSTAVEPSRINKDRSAYLWGSATGSEWVCMQAYRKDWYPLKLFQYGQIRFPAGVNGSGSLWYTPISTRNDQTIQRLAVPEFLPVKERA